MKKVIVLSIEYWLYSKHKELGAVKYIKDKRGIKRLIYHLTTLSISIVDIPTVVILSPKILRQITSVYAKNIGTCTHTALPALFCRHLKSLDVELLQANIFTGTCSTGESMAGTRNYDFLVSGILLKFLIRDSSKARQ